MTTTTTLQTRTDAADDKIQRLLERARFTDLPTDWSAVVGHDHAGSRSTPRRGSAQARKPGPAICHDQYGSAA